MRRLSNVLGELGRDGANGQSQTRSKVQRRRRIWFMFGKADRAKAFHMIAETHGNRRYDVVLALSHECAVNWNREQALATPGGAFSHVAQTFDAWVDKLWEQNGDGRALASPLQERVAAEAVVAGHQFATLKKTPGLSQAIVECARGGFGVASFDAAVLKAAQGEEVHALSEDGELGPLLAASEVEVLRCLAEYAGMLRCQGLIERGEALAYLVQHAAEVFPTKLDALVLDPEPLTRQQQEFFRAVPNIALHHKEDRYPPALGQADVPVCMAFPSGRYAQAQLLLRIVAEALADTDSGEEGNVGGVVIASADPIGLYEKLAPAFVQQGISCSVQGRIGFFATDFGKAFLAAQAVREPSIPWDKAALTDVLHSSLVGLNKVGVWNWDRRLRGDRIVRRESVLDALRETEPDSGQSANAAFRMLDDMVQSAGAGRGELGEWGDRLVKQFHANPAVGRSAAYAQEQRNACIAALDVISMAERFGSCDDQVVSSLLGELRFSCSRASYPQTDDRGENARMVPQVRIMSQDRAARLASRSADTLIVCDLTTESYPLRESRSAAATLLRQLGAGPRDTALARARRDFASLLRVPARLVVLERCLNDANADPYYPSAMLEEFARAYQRPNVELQDAALEKRYGFPAALLQGRYECGEEDLAQDLRPRFTPASLEMREIAHPVRGRAGRRAGEVAPHVSRSNEELLPRLSASQLENYLDCPYKWFVSNRLKATELDEELGPREEGSFLHEVFQVFYQRFGRKVTADNLDQAEALMFGSDGKSGVFDQLLAAQYAVDEQGRNRLGRMVVLAGTTEEREIAHLRNRVKSWLRFETSFLPGFSPVAFECEIEGVEYEGCEIKGVIDRVDVDSSGRAVVIDYKGALKARHRALKGEGFAEDGKVQALVYAQILKEAGTIALGLPQSDPTRLGAKSRIAPNADEARGASDVGEFVEVSDVVGALYVSYNKGNAVAGAFDASIIGAQDIPTLVSARSCELFPGSALSFDAALGHTATRVREAVSRMNLGDVDPCPSGPEACSYCPVEMCEKRWGNGSN